MKKHTQLVNLFLAAIIAVSCSSCSTDEPTQDSNNPGTETPGNGNNNNNGNENDSTASSTSSVIFFDDFTGTSSVPDTTKWSLCQRGDAHWAKYLSESYDQAYQKDGYLYLVAERNEAGDYITGGIETRGKFDFTYGKVECRARFLRQPEGNHCGIWMMPSPPAQTWPKSGEIDIMEHIKDTPTVYGTIHSWYIDDMKINDPSGHSSATVDNSDWNTYGLVWTPDSLIITVNDREYVSYPNLHLSDSATAAYQWPFDHPFYLILSQTLGGDGTWAGPIDNAELPAIFQIDWIKVTSLK